MATIIYTALSGDGPDYTVELIDGRKRIFHAATVPDDAQAYVDVCEREMMIRELQDELND